MVNLVFLVYKLAWNAKLRIKRWIAKGKHMKEMRKRKAMAKVNNGMKKRLNIQINAATLNA